MVLTNQSIAPEWAALNVLRDARCRALLRERRWGRIVNVTSVAVKEPVDWSWAFQRQWLFYKLWGRLLYDPETPDSVFQAVFDLLAERRLVEVPVGFKWFVPGLLDGSVGFGGEESAGASVLRRDGSVWTTDKDGIIMDLLAAEITAVLSQDPGLVYHQLEERFGSPVYERIDFEKV